MCSAPAGQSTLFPSFKIDWPVTNADSNEVPPSTFISLFDTILSPEYSNESRSIRIAATITIILVTMTAATG